MQGQEFLNATNAHLQHPKVQTQTMGSKVRLAHCAIIPHEDWTSLSLFSSAFYVCSKIFLPKINKPGSELRQALIELILSIQ